MKTVIIVFIAIIVLYCGTQIYFIMVKTETQPYQVIKKEKDFEIRKYPPGSMACVSMDAKLL